LDKELAELYIPATTPKALCRSLSMRRSPMTRGARPRNFHALWAAVLAAAVLAAGAAAAAGSPAGRWAAEVDGPGGKKAEIYLVLAQKDGVWTGSLEDPALGSAPVTGLKVTATAVSFKFQPQGAPFAVNFSGSYVAGDDREHDGHRQQADVHALHGRSPRRSLSSR